MPKKKLPEISADDVILWMGSDATIEEYADVIASVANGEYLPRLLNSEVSDYSDSNE